MAVICGTPLLAFDDTADDTVSTVDSRGDQIDSLARVRARRRDQQVHLTVAQVDGSLTVEIRRQTGHLEPRGGCLPGQISGQVVARARMTPGPASLRLTTEGSADTQHDH